MNNITKNQNNSIKSLISILIVLWAAIVFFATQSVAFETNDDSSMARMAYGMLGYYETHLVYINVFIGQCLKFCLTLFPNVPWYTVFHCGIVFVSFVSLVYLFLCRFGVGKGLFPSFILLFFFGAQFFLKLQFSKTAGIASLAGILLVFDAVTSRDTVKLPQAVFGGILSIVGSMYRFNMFCMMLIPLFGIGLFAIAEPIRERSWRKLVNICLPFILILAACFAFRVYDRMAYDTSVEWAGYKEFNSLRSKLTDYGYPDFEENRQLYESLGITESDLNVYKRWDFADSEVITTETLRQLVEAKTKPEISVRECIRTVLEFFLGYKYSAAMLAALFIALVSQKKKRGFLLAYVFLSIVGIQVYLFCNGRYGANRVDAPMACALFVVIALYTWESAGVKNRSLSVVLTVLVLLAPFGEYFLNGSETDAAENEPVIFYDLAATDKEHLYVRTTVTDIPHLPRATEIYPVGYMSNCCALGGWATNTGTFRDILDTYGVTNLYRDLVDNPDLYFVPSESYMKSRISYIRRNYAPKAAAYAVKVTEDGHTVYRICTSPHPVLDTAQAVAVNGLEWAHYSCEILMEEEAALSGHFYLDNTNSFASSIYYSLTNEKGKETLYFATQHYSDAFGDLMNGEYGAFTAVLPKHGDTDQLKLYIEADDVLYSVDLGTIGQYKQGSAAQ